MGTYTVVADFPGSADYAASSSAPATFNISRATPTVTFSNVGGEFDGSPLAATVAITGTGADSSPSTSLDGVTPTLTYYDGSGTSGTDLGATPPTAVGTYTVVASLAASANYTAVQSAPVTFKIRPAITTVGLTSSTGSAVFGQLITFVANVTAAVPPGGTVTFFDNGSALATLALDGSRTATLSTSFLAIGSHSITATYSGDANFIGSHSGSATASVGQSASKIVLLPHPALKKKRVASEVLTAEIQPTSPGGGVPTGIVSFELLTKKRKKIHTKDLGTASVSGGEAMLTVKPKKVLGKVITIIYSGDTNFTASTLTAHKLSKKGLL